MSNNEIQNQDRSSKLSFSSIEKYGVIGVLVIAAVIALILFIVVEGIKLLFTLIPAVLVLAAITVIVFRARRRSR